MEMVKLSAAFTQSLQVS